VIPAQVAFRPEAAPAEGLRSRKKVKTRVAIEDAALALFEEQGYEATTVEQIADRAEVSTTTFFRYFPTKAEVLLSDHGQQLPALHEAIVERPLPESDLVAVRRAVQQEWVATIDPGRTARKARIVATSHALRGMSFERGFRWLSIVTAALAQRRDLQASDERCSVAARVALGVLGSAVEGWIEGGCREDLASAVEHSFNVATELCGEWSRSKPT
jgi:AcrR family transcriptional regulator